LAVSFAYKSIAARQCKTATASIRAALD